MSKGRPPLRVGDLFPNLNAVSTAGEIESLHAYFGGSWGLILVQPRAFAPIGTVELAEAARLAPEWARRDVKPLALTGCSIDDVRKWFEARRAASETRA